MTDALVCTAGFSASFSQDSRRESLGQWVGLRPRRTRKTAELTACDGVALQDVGAGGQPNELRHVPQAELPVDAIKVRVDCLARDSQLDPDVARDHALRRQ